jgi:hypothetical protein
MRVCDKKWNNRIIEQLCSPLFSKNRPKLKVELDEIKKEEEQSTDKEQSEGVHKKKRLAEVSFLLHHLPSLPTFHKISTNILPNTQKDPKLCIANTKSTLRNAITLPTHLTGSFATTIQRTAQ